MTERLYYENSYLLEFDACVEKVREDNGKFFAALNRSAFYPTSGGQPYDTGKLDDATVLDVFVDAEGEVWHELNMPVTIGRKVHGVIDAERRFDHMAQHAADHMIAGALYETMKATTIGLHIGDKVSSIDVQFSDGKTRLDDETIERIEDMVNDRIRMDAGIRCWFPTEEELRELPLRKAPTVKEHIRIVAIGDFEMVACGGTHPAKTGEIGLVKILEVTPARGKARVTFVAGKRAFENYRECFRNAHAAARELTTHVDLLPDAVAALREKLKEQEKQLKALQKAQLTVNAERLFSKTLPEPSGLRIIRGIEEIDADLLRDLALQLIRNERTIALLGGGGKDALNLVFARSADLDLDMGKLMRETGARGGGRPDLAQGRGTCASLDMAAAELKKL